MTVTWNAQQGDVLVNGTEASWVPPLNADAGKASMRVQASFQAGPSGGDLYQDLVAWNEALSAVFATAMRSGVAEAQRTVLDWVARGDELVGMVPQVGATQIHANMVATYVWQCLTSAYAAQVSGRISSAQATAIGVAFNTVWGV